MNEVASVPSGTERLVRGCIQNLAVYFPLAKLAKTCFPQEIVAIRYADEWRQFCKDDPSGKNLRIGLWEALRSLWWWAMPLVGLAIIVILGGGFELLCILLETHSPSVVTEILVFFPLAVAVFLLSLCGHHIGKADTILVRRKINEEGGGSVLTVAHRRLIYWRDILQSTWPARILTIPMVVSNKLAVVGSYVAAAFLAVTYAAWLNGF